MSDILIKGMEMPKKGNIGFLLYSDGSVEICGTGSLSKPLFGVPFEKAVALPPHGRLIDADELSYHTITDYKLEGHNVIDLEDIENAPIVLEANNGKVSD